MANSKVQLADGTVLIDISNDTVTASDVVSGVSFHLSNGNQGTGSLTFVTYYTGTTDPSASLGSNGDIYLKVVS